MGCCGIFCGCHGRGVCSFFEEEEISGSEVGICAAESLFAGAVCRSCFEWIFVCFQSVDLGLWDVDHLYFCKGLSGVFYAEGAGKEENFYDVCGLLCTGTSG